MEDKDYYSVLNSHWKKIRLEKEKNKHKAMEIFVFGVFWFSERRVSASCFAVSTACFVC